MQKPVIATMIGDPAGIGPEVIARAWVGGKVHQVSRPILIGAASAMERALGFVGEKAKIEVIEQIHSFSPDQLSDDPRTITVIDTCAMQETELPLGEDTEICGRATAQWLDEMDLMARDGLVDATIMGPISTGSLKLAGKLDKVVSPTPGESYLVLFTGSLRVIHLTDHMSLRSVCDVISKDLVAAAIHDIDSAMRDWGVENPRIAIAGLNPHAMGEEERKSIAPGVEKAKSAGANVFGPISPDSVFRQCIDGDYDIVLAMCHDQGHIAVKTWGFSGNCVVILGPPYLHMSVAHGTAYDIVGTGKADPAMIENAMVTAGYLAAGRGFPDS